jgi:hypothetical protein
MLALYLPILLYAFSTFDLSDESVAAQEVSPVLVEGPETVVLGQNYDAQAYLTATELADGGDIQLRTDNGSVQITDGSQLRVPSASLLGEDEDEATFGYDVTMEYSAIGDTSFTRVLRDSFTVRRPELVATRATAQSLYRQTQNQIRIEVPGLENKPLRLETNGQSISGREIALSPSGGTVSVDAYLVSPDGADTFLGTKEFATITPPPPEIEARDARGESLTSGGTIPRGRPIVQFEPIPDRQFERSFPQDASYQIRRARVSIKKGIRASEEIGTFSLEDGRLNLARPLQQIDARAEDQIIIQLQDVVRINHAGEAIPVDLSDASVSYSFTLS